MRFRNLRAGQDPLARARPSAINLVVSVAVPLLCLLCLCRACLCRCCCREDNQRLQVELERAQQEQSEAGSSLTRLEAAATEAEQASSTREGAAREVLLRLCAANARHERQITAQRLQAAAPRLGSLGVRRRGIDVQEVSVRGVAAGALGLVGLLA